MSKDTVKGEQLRKKVYDVVVKPRSFMSTLIKRPTFFLQLLNNRKLIMPLNFVMFNCQSNNSILSGR